MGSTYTIHSYFLTNNVNETFDGFLSSIVKAGFSFGGDTKEIIKEKLPLFSVNNWKEWVLVGDLFFMSERPFACYMYFYAQENLLCFRLCITAHYFSEIENKQVRLYKAIMKFISYSRPTYMYIDSDEYIFNDEKAIQNEAISLKNNVLTRFYYWFNYLGPELVKTYGRERLFNGPFYKVEDVNTDGLFIQLNPEIYGIEPIHHKREDAIEYLNIYQTWKIKGKT